MDHDDVAVAEVRFGGDRPGVEHDEGAAARTDVLRQLSVERRLRRAGARLVEEEAVEVVPRSVPRDVGLHLRHAPLAVAGRDVPNDAHPAASCAVDGRAVVCIEG